MNQCSCDLVHEKAFSHKNEHLSSIYKNFPVCTMNLLNGYLKNYTHYFVYTCKFVSLALPNSECTVTKVWDFFPYW